MSNKEFVQLSDPHSTEPNFVAEADLIVSNLRPDTSSPLPEPEEPIAVIGPNQVPPLVTADLFSDTAHRLGGSTKIENFDALHVLKYGDLSTAYFATYSLRYANGKVQETNTLVTDVSPDGQIVGKGRIRYILPGITSEAYAGYPFVGWTATIEGARNSGLGMRRLLEMNTIANEVYDMPLRSGTKIEPAAESLWLKLVERGLAVAPVAENNYRYTFKETRNT